MDNELSTQLQEAKEVLQATYEIPTDKFLNCKEYNTILLKLVKDSYDYNKNKEQYDAILTKVFNMTIVEVEKLVTIQEIQKEQQRRIDEVSKPLTSKPFINNS